MIVSAVLFVIVGGGVSVWGLRYAWRCTRQDLAERRARQEHQAALRRHADHRHTQALAAHAEQTATAARAAGDTANAELHDDLAAFYRRTHRD